MDWLPVAFVFAVLLGATLGTMIIVRNPSWWIGLARASVTAAVPAVLKVAMRRMSPEEERRYQECVRRAGTWDHRTKRCKL